MAEIKLPKIPSKVTLSHNGSLVAISYQSDMAGVERVLFLDVASKTFVHTLAGGRFLEPKFHPAQDLMAVVKAGTANQLTIFDTTTWEEIYKHETSTAPALAMTISDDFQSLAMTLADTRIEVWDLTKLGYTNVKRP
ncbi:MAG: hypothetical protein Q8M16_14000 [Pirellulaceae bacterium]|nr:hypothetical protein [Pirellulaceae bacterium]